MSRPHWRNLKVIPFKTMRTKKKKDQPTECNARFKLIKHLEATLTEALNLGNKLPAAVRHIFSVRKPFFTRSATVSCEEQRTDPSVVFHREQEVVVHIILWLFNSCIWTECSSTLGIWLQISARNSVAISARVLSCSSSLLPSLSLHSLWNWSSRRMVSTRGRPRKKTQKIFAQKHPSCLFFNRTRHIQRGKWGRRKCWTSKRAIFSTLDVFPMLSIIKQKH